MKKIMIRICTAMTLIICAIPSSQALMSDQSSIATTLTVSGLSRALQFGDKHLEAQQNVIVVYKIAMHNGLNEHKVEDKHYLDEINEEVSHSKTYGERSSWGKAQEVETKKLNVKEMLQRLKSLSKNVKL